MANDIRLGIYPAANVSSLAERAARSSKGDTEKAARDFESFMLFTMLKELEKTAQFTKKGYAEQTYMSVMYEKVAECLAKKGLGIKELLTRYSNSTEPKVSKPKGDNTVK
jgi:Rod binding domain-containing protein